jgi:beta-lactamase regulating signal transducer with metallopeptidase domain
MWPLLEIAWKSLAVAGLALALGYLLKSRSSAEQSAVAHIGLLAAIVAASWSLIGPTLEIVVPIGSEASELGLFEPSPGSAGPAWLALAPDEAGTTQSRDFAPVLTWDRALLTYVGVAVAFLLMPLLGVVRLHLLRSRAEVVVEAAWISALAQAQRRMGVKRGTALLSTGGLRSPISWGVLQPVILLNEGLLADRAQAEAIIAHELAHVRHLDWAKLILARVATAVLWFNPLIWLLARRCHQLREEAADDAVLRAGVVAEDYAGLLVRAARTHDPSLLLAANGVAAPHGSLRCRVSRILSDEAARSPASRPWMAGWSLSLALIGAALGASTFVPSTGAANALRPPPFEEIEVRGPGHVRLRHGREVQVRLVRGREDQAAVRVEGDRLIIQACRSSCTRDDEPEIEVVTDVVQHVLVDGGGAVQSRGPFPRQGALHATVTRGGVIRLTSLRPDRVKAEIIDGGTIKTTARDTLHGAIQGDGSIVYWGKPSITTSINGPGVLVRADD